MRTTTWILVLIGLALLASQATVAQEGDTVKADSGTVSDTGAVVDSGKVGRPSATSEWKLVRNLELGFEALFPIEPVRSHKESNEGDIPLTQEGFVSTYSPDCLLGVIVIEYSAKVRAKYPQTNLDSSMVSLVESNPYNRLVKVDTISVQGIPGREYVIQNDSAGVERRGRIVVTDRFFYKLACLCRTGTYDPDVYKRFVEGFVLLENSR